MTITVTTRSGKGSPLTQTEMDTNLNNLARDATETQQGNVELANSAETIAGVSTALATHPAGVKALFDSIPSLVSGINGDGTSGSIDLGDLILQWGKIPSTVADTFYGFKKSFPTETFGVIIMTQSNAVDTERETIPHSITTSGFRTRSGGSTNGSPHFFIALGR